MNKGRRHELRDLRWKRRLAALGLRRVGQRDFICYRDQGKPCSCDMCSPGKRGEKDKYKVRRKGKAHTYYKLETLNRKRI